MKTCKDCLHYDGCHIEKTETRYENSGCSAFTDKSDWVHLPCKVGDKIYWLGRNAIHGECQKSPTQVCESYVSSIEVVDEQDFIIYDNRGIDFSPCSVYKTREEAEKALKERQGEQ